MKSYNPKTLSTSTLILALTRHDIAGAILFDDHELNVIAMLGVMSPAPWLRHMEEGAKAFRAELDRRIPIPTEGD